MLVTIRSGKIGPAAAGQVKRPKASRAAATENDANLITVCLMCSRHAATRNSVAGLVNAWRWGVRAPELSSVLPLMPVLPSFRVLF